MKTAIDSQTTITSTTTSPKSATTIPITDYIRAGYPCLYLVSPEEQRVEDEVRRIASTLNFSLHAWNIAEGLIDLGKGSVHPVQDAMEALLAIKELGERTMILLEDYHLFLTAC